jgi:uncharacterized protein (TIGR03663 family)
MKSRPVAGVFLAIVLLAAGLRFPSLDRRPMHADEAVHAAKMGTLVEQGRYAYDPVEFHGPTLNYLTVLPARLQGAVRYADLDERTLRSVPATMGVLLVAAVALLIPLIGAPAAAAAALLTALSPAMVFYSRYYIQETLLVFFSFGALISICRYLLRPGALWAISAGAFVGLMHATKETFVIALGSLLVALFLTQAFEGWRGGDAAVPPPKPWHRLHLLAAVLTAMLVSGLFFSSFLSHPRGIVDSVTAYRTYLERADSSSSHTHPWHYYFDLLLYFRADGGPVWTEGLIVGLALVGFLAALTGSSIPGVDRRMLRFLGFYTVLMATVYSVIPYKTPWCLLGFLHGMILLAGIGAVRLFHAFRTARIKRTLVLACLGAAAVHLGWQAWAGSFRYEADPRNPYVYAHTTTDVFVIAGRIEGLARAHPLGPAMPIQIISRENLWPLPWYLRRFSAVQWWNGVPEAGASAPVILATPDMEDALARKLYELPPPGQRELYVNIFDRVIELRPQVELRGYAAKTLWDDDRQSEAQDASRPRPVTR